MGCWNGTCMISNLPINAGDEIKLVILKEAGGSDDILPSGGFVYNYDQMAPAFLPIEGQYDDYGMIEDIQEDWNTELILNHLKGLYPELKLEGKETTDWGLVEFLRGIERGEIETKSEATMEDKMFAQHVISYSKDVGRIAKAKAMLSDKAPDWRPVKLGFVMILKSVWDVISKDYEGEYWNPNDEKDENGKKIYYVSAQKYYEHQRDITLKILNKESKDGVDDQMKMWELRDLGLFTSNGERSRYEGKEQYIEHFINEETRDSLFEQWVALKKIETFTSQTRIAWMIQCGAGSQTQAYKEHLLLADTIKNIVEEEMAEWEEDEE